MRFTLRPIAAALLAVALLTPSASAQVDADRATLRNYKLSMVTLNKLTTALQELSSDPSMKKLPEDSMKMDDGMSLAQWEAKVNKQAPQVAAAFRKHGVTPRDMMLTMFAMFQAGMIASAEKSGQKISKLPEDMNPENLAFYKQHEAEIQAMAAKMKGIQKANEKEEAEEQEEKEN